MKAASLHHVNLSTGQRFDEVVGDGERRLIPQPAPVSIEDRVSRLERRLDDEEFFHRRLGPNHEREMEWNAQRDAAVKKFVEDIKKVREEQTMGQFKIEITAVGGHGCQREVKDSGLVYGCQRMDCPDCMARELVAKFQSKGMTVESASLTHWPGTDTEVSDDLLSKVRKGSF